MALCIKTGAYIHFVEYDRYGPADLYAVGNCIIAKFNKDGLSYKPIIRPTHKVFIGSLGFWREDTTILVVPKEQINAQD